MRKILQVLDPSHQGWVLGGIFRELREESDLFIPQPVFIPPPNSILNVFRWLVKSIHIYRSDYVLFSSLTALENFGRFRLARSSQVLGIWFTHQEFEFTDFERRQIRRCSYIFVHSERVRESMQVEFPKAEVICMVGAINLTRFNLPAKSGNKVAWVGTAVKRKNPQFLLELAKAAPNLIFRVLGKDWGKSDYLRELKLLSNVEFVEISEALSSSDFDECGVYLMLSQVEGGPMPLLESLAAGLIPICMRTGFVEDLLVPLNLQDNIVESFQKEKILNLISNSLNIEDSAQARINFAKQYNFDRLNRVISGAYFD